MTDRILAIIGAAAREESGTAVGFQAVGSRLSEVELDTQRLTDEISKLLRCIEGIQAPQDCRFDISEVQFNLGVSAKGKLAILAAGVEAGVEAAIKVTIKRTNPGQG